MKVLDFDTSLNIGNVVLSLILGGLPTRVVRAAAFPTSHPLALRALRLSVLPNRGCGARRSSILRCDELVVLAKASVEWQ